MNLQSPIRIRWLFILLLGAVHAGFQAGSAVCQHRETNPSPASRAAWSANPSDDSFQLDPLAVRRYGKGWRHPQSGWIVLHVDGTPYQRGYQHGRLLAGEIAQYLHIAAKYRSYREPTAAWRAVRLLADTAFLRRFDPELLEEMKGIADGAAAGGARFEGRLIDFIDIVSLNADVEIGFLEQALEATANGLDHRDFGRPGASPAPITRRDRCSAFAATFPVTDPSTGGILLGHVTMSDLSWVNHFNVWLDLTPTDADGTPVGHRFACQSFPGGIQSGLDYYVSSSGLIVAETTIQQTAFDVQGEAEASRIRRCVQHAASIDAAVEILVTNNNGLYSNEWLIADTKTNEIAMLELGTRHHKLYRSSRDEWPGGTKGFYWSCNSTKEPVVLSDSVADYRGKPGNLVVSPSLRDVAWIRLFDRHRKRGLLAEPFGLEAFRTAPIVGYPSCDAKFTTSRLAKELSSWVLLGPPLGHAWLASHEELEAMPDVQPLVCHDWTRVAPSRSQNVVSINDKNKSHPKFVDAFPAELGEQPTHVEFTQKHPFAWRGTILPASDADSGLAAAFAEYERVLSFEKALRFDAAHPSGLSAVLDDRHLELKPLDRSRQDLVDVALFGHQSNWWSARQRLGHDVPMTRTRRDDASLEWYPIALGQAVLMLHQLRSALPSGKFESLVDQFGTEHANQAVSNQEFKKWMGKRLDPAALSIIDRWLEEDIEAQDHVRDAWSIYSFELEPEHAVIIYGGDSNREANLEVAQRLQRAVARRFGNRRIPLIPDTDCDAKRLASHHLLIVGEPQRNRWLVPAAAKSAVELGHQSFVVRGECYTNAASGVVVAAANPWNPRFSAVVFAGLSTAASHRIADWMSPDDPWFPEVVVLAADAPAYRLANVR